MDEKKRSPPNDPGRTSTDHAFRETIIITMSFGPGVFLKVICSMEFNSFSVWGGSLYYVLYTFLITLLSNTTVNAKPLSPPIFEKINSHFRIIAFSYFSYLLWGVLYFVGIVLIFGYPLLPPLGQIGSICDRFW